MARDDGRDDSVVAVVRALHDVERDLARAADVPSVRELRACAKVCEAIVAAWTACAPDAQERAAVLRRVDALRRSTVALGRATRGAA